MTWHKPSWNKKQQQRLAWFLKKQSENPAGYWVGYWCSDQYGRPANGGQQFTAKPGLVQKLKNKRPVLCGPGALHATTRPHRWNGLRVWVVALIGAREDDDDSKSGACHREFIGEILPEDCIDFSVFVKIRANLSRANLSRADLSGANLSGANLSGADLYGADLSRADLSRANLSRANLSGANLYWANLYGANLYWANLYGANLSRANLYGADLSRANLSRADLSRADLSGANLSRAYGSPSALPEGWEQVNGVIRKKESV